MRRLWIVGAVGLVSCQPEWGDPYPTPFEPQWEGEQMLFGVGEGAQEVCGGTREFLERSTVALEEVAGEEAPQFSFFVVPRDEVEELCRHEDVLGCAALYKAYAVDAALVHEVVHVVRHFSYGFPTSTVSIFEEGLADLYSTLSTPEPPPKPEDLDAFFDRDLDDRGGPYGRTIASYYLSSLATTYGDKAVWDFVTATEAMREGATLKEVFESQFPESLEAFHERFSQERMCTGAARSRKLVECGEDGPDVYADFGDIVLSATETGYMECSSPEVIGPRAGEMWTTKTFDVLEDMPLFVAVSFTDDPGDNAEDGEDPDAPVDDYVQIMRCGVGCSGYDFRLPDGLTGLEVLNLPPGRYVVRFGRGVDDPGFATLYLSSDLRFPFEE